MAMAISELTGYFYGIIHSINGVLLVLMGVFENSVPLNPMVNDHYPY
jgi:hypothetical protein